MADCPNSIFTHEDRAMLQGLRNCSNDLHLAILRTNRTHGPLTPAQICRAQDVLSYHAPRQR